MNSLEKINAARAQHLLKEYDDLLRHTAEVVKNESHVDISGNTTDEIALEYKRREGIRTGVILFLQKLNSLANERD